MPYVGVSHPGWDGQWIPATVGDGLESQINRLQDRLGAMTAEKDRLREAIAYLRDSIREHPHEEFEHLGDVARYCTETLALDKEQGRG